MLQKELDAAFASARADIDATPLGSWVKDDRLLPLVYNALAAAERVRRARDAEHATTPPPPPTTEIPQIAAVGPA
jgi:hypothetical protein